MWRRQAVVYGGSSSLFILTIGFILLLIVIKRKDEPIPDDPELRRMVRSLSSIQENIDNNLKEEHKVTDIILDKQLPWLRKYKTVPNYYLNYLSRRSKNLRKFNLDSSLVFVHIPRTAGSYLITCLNNMSFTFDLPMSPLMDIQNRMLWDAGHPDTNSFKDHIKIHRGRYSFGMCENLQQKCAYFMLVRDPFARAVSSYKNCRNVPNFDEQCLALNANSVSLKEWILEQGSVLFNQIVFSPHFCSENKYVDFNLTNLDKKFISNVDKIPCWYKQQLILNKKLTPSDKKHITNYIIDNLEKWFSAIGLFEELRVSLKLFENVLNLPFTKCDDASQIKSKIEDNIITNSARSNRDQSDNDVTKTNENIEDEDDLLDDEYVTEALSSDYRIYKEAKRIFHIQKQVLFNTVAR